MTDLLRRNTVSCKCRENADAAAQYEKLTAVLALRSALGMADLLVKEQRFDSDLICPKRAGPTIEIDARCEDEEDGRLIREGEPS
jgi:hypothetical protein